MGRTLRVAIFWARNALIDKAYYRQEPATDLGRRYMAKARSILDRHGLRLDIRPMGALQTSAGTPGHELPWAVEVGSDPAIIAVRTLAATSAITLEDRLPVIFCRFARSMMLATRKPPYLIDADTSGLLGWTISKTLEEPSGVFYGYPFKPFVLMNSLMNPKDPNKAAVLAHEIVHAADVPHHSSASNLMFEDGNLQGDSLTKVQLAKVEKAYFAA